MKPFKKFTGVIAPLPYDNIDTDAIIPSREIRSPEKTGFGEKLFSAWRYLDNQQTENPEFILNQDNFRDSSILLAGHNFGCGSSREMAVWALMQFGFKTIIARSFGSIFRNNCNKNGLLTIELSDEPYHALNKVCAKGSYQINIDLENQIIELDSKVMQFKERFDIDNEIKNKLLRGEDDISKTLNLQEAIKKFCLEDRKNRPWIW
jgi:3-isopropylmalate/(R)-2-methylmalate dehydratase small subunit